jgi:hypothetical protein
VASTEGSKLPPLAALLVKIERSQALATVVVMNSVPDTGWGGVLAFEVPFLQHSSTTILPGCET